MAWSRRQRAHLVGTPARRLSSPAVRRSEAAATFSTSHAPAASMWFTPGGFSRVPHGRLATRERPVSKVLVGGGEPANGAQAHVDWLEAPGRQGVQPRTEAERRRRLVASPRVGEPGPCLRHVARRRGSPVTVPSRGSGGRPRRGCSRGSTRHRATSCPCGRAASRRNRCVRPAVHTCCRDAGRHGGTSECRMRRAPRFAGIAPRGCGRQPPWARGRRGRCQRDGANLGLKLAGTREPTSCGGATGAGSPVLPEGACPNMRRETGQAVEAVPHLLDAQRPRGSLGRPGRHLTSSMTTTVARRKRSVPDPYGRGCSSGSATPRSARRASVARAPSATSATRLSTRPCVFTKTEHGPAPR